MWHRYHQPRLNTARYSPQQSCRPPSSRTQNRSVSEDRLVTKVFAVFAATLNLFLTEFGGSTRKTECSEVKRISTPFPSITKNTIEGIGYNLDSLTRHRFALHQGRHQQDGTPWPPSCNEHDAQGRQIRCGKRALHLVGWMERNWIPDR